MLLLFVFQKSDALDKEHKELQVSNVLILKLQCWSSPVLSTCPRILTMANMNQIPNAHHKEKEKRQGNEDSTLFNLSFVQKEYVFFSLSFAI